MDLFWPARGLIVTSSPSISSSSAPTITGYDLLNAVERDDMDAFQRLATALSSRDPKTGQMMLRFVDGTVEAMIQAVRLGRDTMVEALWPITTETTHAYALGAALEYDRPILARQFQNRLKDPAMPDHEALGLAASKNWVKAVRSLLAMGAPLQGSFRINMDPLSMAAEHGHLEMIEVLLPHVTPTSRDTQIADALEFAANKNQAASVELLWPMATPGAKGRAFVQAVNHNYTDLSHWILDRLETMTDRLKVTYSTRDLFPKMLTQAISGRKIEQGPTVIHVLGDRRLIERLIPLAKLDEADYELALPLRRAMENGLDDLIPLLLPLSDVTLARKGWTREKPARWDMVDALTRLAPPDIRKKWLKQDTGTGHLRQAKAAAREERALELTPSAPPSTPENEGRVRRMRHRS